MIVITMTNPLAAGSGEWFEQLMGRYVDRTAFGFDDASRRAMPLFALLLLCAAVAALLATPRLHLARADAACAGLALASWFVISHESPTIVEAGGPHLALPYVGVAAAALLALVVLRVVSPDQRSGHRRG
jgi:hypothetical protein